jgi:hypothetical protein
VRRKTPRQLKVGRVRPTSSFKPLAEYMPDIRCSMIEQIACCLAIRADLYACSRKFACEPDSHGTTERSFIEFHNFRAIGYYKDLLSLEGAVQPIILDGTTNTLPAFCGDKDHWILWMSMPDTNQPGHPISPLQFRIEWVQPTTTPTNDPHKDLLHHLFQSHAAELRSVGKGTWTKHHGQPPRALVPSAVRCV